MTDRDDETGGADDRVDRAKLAEAVAHDLSNLLTAIGGSAELLETSLAPDDPARATAAEIVSAVSEASLLVRLVSDRSWDRPTLPSELDVQDVLEVVARLVRKLVPRTVDVRPRAPARRELLYAEPVVILRALLGLCEWLAGPSSAAGGSPAASLVLGAEGGDDHVAFEVTVDPAPAAGACPDALLRLAARVGVVEGGGGRWRLVVRRAEPRRSLKPEAPPSTDRVLIAEPDPLVRSLVVTALGTKRIDEVWNQAGLERLLSAGARYDLVLLCASSCELDARAMVRRLRASDAGTRFVLIGSEGSLDDELRYLVDGDDRVVLLQKPFGVARLKHAIDLMTDTVARDEREVKR